MNKKKLNLLPLMHHTHTEIVRASNARVEDVEHVSDSNSEERKDLHQSQAHLIDAIYPAHQEPTYLILPGKHERDNWLHHLTVSGGGLNSVTQYKQWVQKPMGTDGEPSKRLFILICIH